MNTGQKILLFVIILVFFYMAYLIVTLDISKKYEKKQYKNNSKMTFEEANKIAFKMFLLEDLNNKNKKENTEKEIDYLNNLKKINSLQEKLKSNDFMYIGYPVAFKYYQ
jgi:hypothetical protein